MKRRSWIALLLIFLLGLFGYTLHVWKRPRSVFPTADLQAKLDAQMQQQEEGFYIQAGGMTDPLKILDEAFASTREIKNLHEKEIALKTITTYLVQVEIDPLRKVDYFHGAIEEVIKMKNSLSKVEVTLSVIKGVVAANLSDEVKEELLIMIMDKLTIYDKSA